MGLRSDVYAYLKTIGSVTTLIGSGDDIRLYPAAAPTATTTRPYVTFDRISQERDHHLTASSGLANAALQFDIVDTDRLSAEAVEEALRGAFDSYNEGEINGSGSTDVRYIEMTDSRDDYLPPTDDSEVGIWVLSCDFEFWFVESIPTFPAS